MAVRYKNKIIEMKNDIEIGEAILELGDKFRGLWRCNELPSTIWYSASFVKKWYVTFVYKEEYVETPSCDTIYEALNFALEKVKQEKECLDDHDVDKFHK